MGMAAGIAAAFNAPIAAVTFTLEELIGSLDQTMLSGVIVAAALAAVVEHSIMARIRSFMCRDADFTLANASSLVWYALLGLLAALSRLRSLIRCSGCGRGSSGSLSTQVGASGHWRHGHGRPGRGGDRCFFT